MSRADFFTTLRSSDHDFIAALRFLDDYAKNIYERGQRHQTYHHFVPRFDLEQHADTYELYGELPGFRREDIIIEANDDHNLQISGSISPLKPELLPSDETTQPQDQSASKEINGEASGEASGKPKPESKSEAKVPPEELERLEKTTTNTERYLNDRFGDVLEPQPYLAPKKEVEDPNAMIPEVRYLISERHSSSFHRAFHFPTPIKREEILATMQDGILHVSAKRAPMPPPVKVEVRDDLVTPFVPVMS